MAKSMKKMLLLAKVETVSGTDAVPDQATNAILVRAYTPEPITAEFVPRDLIRPYKGNSPSLPVGIHRQFTFEVELAGSGTASTAPKWGPLLRACGFSQTVESPGVVYRPISEGEPTLSMYGYIDGLLFKMIRSKGTVVFQMNAKSIPVMQFTFLGEYSTPTDETMPTTPDYSGFMQPQTVGRIYTPTFEMHGVSACMQSFSVDLANQLIWRELVNCGGPASPDRKPTGSAVIELTTAAQKNWAEVLKNGTEDSVEITHGTVAGNIVTLEMPKVQLSGLSLQDSDSIAMLNVSFTVNPNAGNDELIVSTH